MNKLLQKMGLVLSVALLLFTYMPHAMAESGSIGITPAFPREDNVRSRGIFVRTIKGGEVADEGVQVFNYTKEERKIVLGAVDSIAASDGSFSCKQNSEKQKEMGVWVKLQTTELTLPPESNEVIKFTISVPTDAGPGEHGGCITAQDTKNFAATGGAGVQLGFRNAIRVAVTVPGEIVKALAIKRIDVKHDKADIYTIMPVASNTGNVSLDVKARVQLKSMFGQKTIIKTADFPVIRGAVTGWGFEFKRPFWGGFYKANASLSYNANTSDGLGVNTGDQKKISLISDYFFMIPAPQAIAAELAVVFTPIAFLILYINKRRQRKKLRKNWHLQVVEESDTIMSLASKTGVKWKRVAKINNIKAPYVIHAGQKLLLPKKQPSKRSNQSWVTNETSTQVEAVDTPPSTVHQVSSSQVEQPAPITQIETVSQAPRQPAVTPKPIERVYAIPAKKVKKRGKPSKYDWAIPTLYYGDPPQGDKTMKSKSTKQSSKNRPPQRKKKV